MKFSSIRPSTSFNWSIQDTPGSFPKGKRQWIHDLGAPELKQVGDLDFQILEGPYKGKFINLSQKYFLKNIAFLMHYGNLWRSLKKET